MNEDKRFKPKKASGYRSGQKPGENYYKAVINNKDKSVTDSSGKAEKHENKAVATATPQKKKISGKCRAEKLCGGCNYLAYKYDEQLKLKQKYIEGLFSEYVKVKPIIGMQDPLYYRNKVHHAFAMGRGGEIISGSYAADTHRVVSTEDCLLEDRKSQDIIKTIRKLAKSFKYKPYNEDSGHGLLRHVLIRRGFESGEILVVLVLTSPILPGKKNFVKALREKHPDITSIVINVNDQDTSMVLGERNIPIFGPGFIKDKLCGLSYRISPSSFYQINPVQTEVLYNTAIQSQAS